MAHIENKVQTLVKRVLKDAYYVMDLHCRIVPSVTQPIMVPLHIINILEKIHAHLLVLQASTLNLGLVFIVKLVLLCVMLVKCYLIIAQQLMGVPMVIISIMQRIAVLPVVLMAYMLI